MTLDVGKTIASVILVTVAIQVAERVHVFATQDGAGWEAIGGIIIAMSIGLFLAVKFWRHDEEIRRWMVVICRLSYALIPLIIGIGMMMGRPFTIGIPFYRTSTTSFVIPLIAGVAAMMYFALLHWALTSEKARREFSPAVEDRG